jgi:predicted ATPase/DNA-binding SARP family transcriptional activator
LADCQVGDLSALWTIQLLGGLAAYSPQRQLRRFRTQKAASLLAYLAFHRAPHPRETLIDLVWPDTETEVGRHNLSMALSFLRHQLEPTGVPPGTVILADRFSVRLNPAAVTVDVAEFERGLWKAEAEDLSEVGRLELLLGAVEQYQGALLPGFYEEWIAPEALRLEGLFVQAVTRLVPLLLAAGKPEATLMYARRAVSADPLSETATRSLMQALMASGQCAQAVRAYRQLERRLREELDTKPSPELQHLAERLRQSGPGLKTDLTARELPTAKAGVFSRARTPVAERPATSSDSATEGAVSRGRLVGAEFLLRTTTRFFGRDEEIARLSKMLSTPRTRLVTLTGAGGTGKTRLSLEVAAQLVASADDASVGDVPTRAVFVPLAPVTEGERLFDVILRSLGIVPVSHQDPLEQLASALEALPHTLLILDNFEQLAEAGALRVGDLLGKCAAVKLLVTSRQRLQIEGEGEFHLAPLPTFAGARTPEELLKVPGIALFVDRAQLVRPDFLVTANNACTLAELCDQLEGIPLALELAAARVKMLSVRHILEQVQANRLDFLATRRRDAHTRHRTLRATLDWSYQLLPESAQALLAALSVFRGGWALEAARAVRVDLQLPPSGEPMLIDNRQSTIEDPEALELLTLLRDSSLIEVTDTAEGVRFMLLETIREYGLEKLVGSGEYASIRGRHRDYFAALAQQAESELIGPDQARWLDCLQIEHDNLCTAIEWYETDAASARVGLLLVGALSYFWEIRGYLSLGRGYLSRALSRAEASAPTLERAKALQGAGSLARSQGDYASARTLNEESLTIRRELGDKRSIAHSLNSLGDVANDQGDYASARTLYEQSLAMRRELGDKAGIAHSLYWLGLVAHAQGDYGAARTLYQESLALYREIGHSFLIHALGALGHLEREVGDYGRAAALYQESLLLRRERGELLHTACSLEDFAGLAVRLGQQERAVRLLGAAEALCETLGRTLPLAIAAEYERTVAAAHSALSAEVFAAAWKEGRQMTMEQAVAYALKQISD